MAIRTIYNKRTGEMRQVDDTQLSTFGIKPRPQANFAVQNTQPDYGSIESMYSQDSDPTNPTYWLNQGKKSKQYTTPYDLVSTQATPQETIDTSKPKSFEGLAQNAMRDVGNVVTGITAIPKVFNAWKQDPANMTGKIAGAVVGGVVDDYVKLFTDPVNTLYNRPVTGTLDALSIIVPAVKGVKAFKAAKAAKASQVASTMGAVSSPLDNIVAQSDEVFKAATTLGLGPDDADDVAKIAMKSSFGLDDADDIADIAKGAGLSVEKTKQLVDVARKNGTSISDVESLARSLEKGAKADVPAYQAWLSQFTVPTKRAAQLDTPMVAKYVFGRYGITANNVDDYKTIANVFTGKSGMFNKMTKGALAQLDDPIDITGVADDIARQAKRSALVPEAEKLSHLDSIYDALKTYSGVVPDADPRAITHINALDAFDLAKQWEDFGHSLINKSTYLTQYPHWEQVGKIYLKGADRLVRRINQTLRSTNILDAYKTPDVIDDIAKISPQLAKDFVKAKTFKDLRRLQMPFVRVSQMSDLTAYARNSAALQLARSMGMQTGGAIVGGAIGGVPAAIAGTAISPVLTPIAEKAMSSLTPRVANAFAKYLKASQGFGSGVGAGLKAGTKAQRAAYLKQMLPLIIMSKLITEPQTTIQGEPALPNATPASVPMDNLPLELQGGEGILTGVNPIQYNEGGY